MLAAKKIMSRSEALEFLNCRRLPARLNTSEASILLGIQEHDISALIAALTFGPAENPLGLARGRAGEARKEQVWPSVPRST